MISTQNTFRRGENQNPMKDQENFSELPAAISTETPQDPGKEQFRWGRVKSRNSKRVVEADRKAQEEDMNTGICRHNAREKETRECRVNTLKIKAQLCKRLGPERATHYFRVLGRFLSCQMVRREYVEAMEQIVGKENIPLHSQLVRSILRNAMAGPDEMAGSSE